MKIIYAIQHNKTKRIYVGNTGRPGRIEKHFSLLRNGKHDNELMQEDYEKYGNDYTTYILEVVLDGTETRRERHWMQYFNTHNPEYGYNYKDSLANKPEITDYPEYSDEKIRFLMSLKFPWQL